MDVVCGVPNVIVPLVVKSVKFNPFPEITFVTVPVFVAESVVPDISNPLPNDIAATLPVLPLPNNLLDANDTSLKFPLPDAALARILLPPTFCILEYVTASSCIIEVSTPSLAIEKTFAAN